RDGEHQQQADIHVCDYGPVWSKRNHGEDYECSGNRDIWSEEKDPPIRFLGNEVFLCQKLQTVGDWLQQTPRADTHWSESRLHKRRDFSFEIGHVSNPQCNERDYETDLNERPNRVVDCLLIE